MDDIIVSVYWVNGEFLVVTYIVCNRCGLFVINDANSNVDAGCIKNIREGKQAVEIG